MCPRCKRTSVLIADRLQTALSERRIVPVIPLKIQKAISRCVRHGTSKWRYLIGKLLRKAQG